MNKQTTISACNAKQIMSVSGHLCLSCNSHAVATCIYKQLKDQQTKRSAKSGRLAGGHAGRQTNKTNKQNIKNTNKQKQTKQTK